jgi:hypothetical protein
MHVQGQERDFALKLRHIEAINSSQQVSRIKKMAIEAGGKIYRSKGNYWQERELTLHKLYDMTDGAGRNMARYIYARTMKGRETAVL